MSFEARLSALLKERGYNYKTLGDAVAISNSLIGAWCKGSKKPSFESLVFLADFFEVSMDFLACRSNERGVAVSETPDDIRRVMAAYHSLNDKGREVAVDMLETLTKSHAADSSPEEKEKRRTS